MIKRRSTRGCRTEDDGSIFLSEQVFNFRVQKHLNSVLFIKTSCVNVLKVPLELWSAQNHGSTTVSVLGGTAKSTRAKEQSFAGRNCWAAATLGSKHNHWKEHNCRKRTRSFVQTSAKTSVWRLSNGRRGASKWHDQRIATPYHQALFRSSESVTYQTAVRVHHMIKVCSLKKMESS